MPYIKSEERVPYNDLVDKLSELVKDYGEQHAATYGGQLNYIITTLLLKTYADTLPNYSDYNEIIGVLECAKLEMYRRQTAPYEDVKIEENGNV